MKQGMDELAEIAQRIGRRIRQSRIQNGMTLGALGKTTALSTAFLSRLERGKTSTSIANLILIADALGVLLQDLFTDDQAVSQPSDYVLLKREFRQSNPMFSAAGYKYERLGGDLPGQGLDAFELEFPVSGDKPMLLVAHEGEEILFLLSGEIEFQVGSSLLVMEEGDCLHFDARQPHMGRNIGSEPARMLMVVSPSSSTRSRFSWWNAAGAVAGATGSPKDDEADVKAVKSYIPNMMKGGKT